MIDRLSAECLDASWGSAAEARRLADAMAENDAMAERAAAIDTDAIEGWAFVQCGLCVFGAVLVIIAAILIIAIWCGGL